MNFKFFSNSLYNEFFVVWPYTIQCLNECFYKFSLNLSQTESIDIRDLKMLFKISPMNILINFVVF